MLSGSYTSNHGEKLESLFLIIANVRNGNAKKRFLREVYWLWCGGVIGISHVI